MNEKNSARRLFAGSLLDGSRLGGSAFGAMLGLQHKPKQRIPQRSVAHPAPGERESLPYRAVQKRSVRLLASGSGLFALVVGQTLLPGLFMMCQANAAQAARLEADKKFVPKWYAQAQVREAQGRGSQPGRIKPSEPLECAGGDCEVTVKALDLTRVPTEKELRKAGQLGGALSPLRPAEPAALEARLDRALKALGVANGLASQAANDKPGGKAVAYAKKKLKRARDINQSFGEAIQEWNKHNFRAAAKMFKKHLDEYPDSPWAGEAALHLGCDAKYNGRFAEAQATYDTILQNTSANKANSAARPVAPAGDWLAAAMANNQTPEGVLDAAEDATDYSFDIRQKAKLRWADLDLSLGRWKDAETKLADLLRTDNDWRRLTWARHWMRNASAYKRSRALQACGSQALSVVLVSLERKDAAAKVAQIPAPREEGFSLNEIAGLARRNGVPMQGFKATSAHQLAGLPLPLIVHYDFGWDGLTARGKFDETKDTTGDKANSTVNGQLSGQPGGEAGALKEAGALSGSLDWTARVPEAAQWQAQVRRKAAFAMPRRAGHFLVVKKVDDAAQSVQLFDPLEKRHYYLSFEQFEKEWSGKGLMLAKGASAPQKVSNSPRVALLSGDKMKTTRGGCCGVPAVENDDCSNYTGGGGGCGTSGAGARGAIPGTGGGLMAASSLGSPVWSVNKLNINLRVTDTPMWYSTPKGPDVQITMTYNSNDATTQNNPFGNKWMFNYASYAVEDTTAGGGRVTVFNPDGSKSNYVPDGNGNYTPQKPGDHTILRKFGSTRYELEFEGGDKAIYDIPANTSSLQPFLIELRDRWGYSLTFGYNADVRLTTITDAAGKITRLHYDNNGHIVAVFDPFGRQVSFSYDANNNMVEAVDMEGHAFQYTYDSSVRLTQLNTAQGPWQFYHEGPDGGSGCSDCYPYPGGPTWQNIRLTITDPAGKKEEYFYNGGYTNLGTEIVDPQIGEGLSDGLSWHVSKNAYVVYGTNGINNASPLVPKTRWIVDKSTYPPNRVRRMLHPNGDNEYYVNNAALGVPSEITNPRGNKVQVTYNGEGQIATIKDAKNQVTTFSYYPNGKDVQSIVNAQGTTVATYTYDAKHQPLTITDGSGQVTSMTYTAWGAPATATADGQTTTFNYNSAGQVTSIARGGTPLAFFTYDAMNRVKTQTDTQNRTVSYEYNSLDKITKVTYPDGTFVSYDYVCCGLPGAVRDRAGRWTYYDYDVMKRVVRMQDSAGRQVGMDYDANGNLIRLTDAKGNKTNWQYDARDRVVKKTYADGSYESYTYSGTNRVLTRRSAQGQTTSYAYDANDNLTGVDYPNMADVALTYNALDKPLSMTDGMGTTAFAYDTMGRLTSVDGPFANDTVSYNYDAQGRRQWMKVNGADQVSYGYDALSRLQSITAPSGTFGYSYVGATGQVAQLTMPNGTKTDYSYDSLGRLTQQANLTAANGNISTYGFAYDGDNRNLRVAVSEQVGGDPLRTVSYGYNSADELTSEAGVGGANETPQNNSYAYDKMGNRTQSQHAVSGGGTFAVSYSNNGLNQTTGRVGSGAGLPPLVEALEYDASGNLRVWGNKRLSYDDANRLVEVVHLNADGSNQRKSAFFYDGLNRRRVVREWVWAQVDGVWQWQPQTETRFVYDGLNVVQERNGADEITAKNLWGASMGGGIGGLLSRSVAQGDLFYHYDGRGNVVQLTDANAQAVARYSYDAFGGLRRSEGAADSLNPYRFSTKWMHGFSGLSDYGFRFYAPQLGKWINRDPIAERGGLNLFSSFLNDPINLSDAEGLSTILIGAGVGLVAGFGGNALGQGATALHYWLSGNWECYEGFDWTSAAASGLSGAVTGAIIATPGLAPFASSWYGNLIIGGVANGGEYAVTQWAHGRPICANALLFNAGVGAIFGWATGGPFHNYFTLQQGNAFVEAMVNGASREQMFNMAAGFLVMNNLGSAATDAGLEAFDTWTGNWFDFLSS